MIDSELLQYLSEFLTPERRYLFNKVLAERTRYATVVLEDIYQPQNASAVLRTCDCFGIQDVHVIENEHKYDINPDVVIGADKWLNLHKYADGKNNSLEAIRHLKSKGYRIVATTPHTDEVLLEDFNVEAGKFALVFGTEQTGISETVAANADEFLRIPMYGFTESYNISVSAAICLHHLTYKLRQTDINWQLSKEEADEIRFEWLKKSIKKSELIIQRFLENKPR